MSNGIAINPEVLDNKNNVDNTSSLSEKYNVDLFSENTVPQKIDYKKNLFIEKQKEVDLTTSLFTSSISYNETSNDQAFRSLFTFIIFVVLMEVLFMIYMVWKKRKNKKKEKNAKSNI